MSSQVVNIQQEERIAPMLHLNYQLKVSDMLT